MCVYVSVFVLCMFRDRVAVLKCFLCLTIPLAFKTQNQNVHPFSFRLVIYHILPGDNGNKKA